MTKRSATTPLGPETPPKKPKATKKTKVAEQTPDIEEAPVISNSQVSASNTPVSAEEDAISPIDDVEDTSLASGEIDPTPETEENAKASTSEKTGVKASASKESSEAIAPKAQGNKRPVGEGFDEYKHSIVKSAFNQFWGDKPMTGSARPAPDQPSARASNGQTNPPLFENRGYRYKRGARYVKHHYTIDPTNMASLPLGRDQEVLLAVPLIDMRLNRKTSVPKRLPEVYCYGKKPKDWNCKQSIKALNDRRYQAIDRETMDAPWSEIEREHLAQLIRDDPDASILDLTERHNDRFMDKDYKESVGFAVGGLSTGRTVESVRYQYAAYKPFYDRGRVPVVRWRGDKSAQGIALTKWIVGEDKFGKPSKAEQLAHDKAHGDAEGSDDEDEGTPNKTSKNSEESDVDDLHPNGKRHASEELEDDERPVKYTRTGEGNPFAGQEQLHKDDEDLIDLAVDYDDDEASPSRRGDSDVEEVDEPTEYREAETQADSDPRATRNIEVDENYDD
ncbi:hypothetical protein ACET3X_002008 [Alternaria dauci]|uniref:Myb-like domain-containing protein n=1 Tax=Alternaria dauci TaxID=48095 RepID=A0ABR3V0Z0_9PLEO